jgi:hypothetical protein
MSRYYILVDREPVEATLKEWGEFMDSSRGVMRTHIGKTLISTVFLGIDHGYRGCSPLLFETMIFPEVGEAEYQERCATYQEALIQHDKAVDYAKRHYNGT